MDKISDNENLLNRLRSEENAAFKEIYTKYFYTAKSYILQNKGNLSDAEDIFQEALFILVKNIRSQEFEIKVSFGSYMQSIVRYTWLNKLRGKREFSNDVLPELLEEDIILHEAVIQKDAHHNLLELVLSENLKEDCKQLLQSFYYLKLSLGQIAKNMHLTESFIKVKKHRCMEYLANAYTQHPDFKNIKNA